MSAEIKQGIKKALSGSEIQALVPGMKVNIIKYSELYDARRLEDVMPAVMLFCTQKDFGHWVTIYEDDRGDLNFYDSYGYKPDSELLFVKKSFRKEAGQDVPLLTAMMLEWKQRHPRQKVIWNEHRVQSKGGNISTCGRHAALRLRFREMPLEEYTIFLRMLAKKLKKPIDYVVTLLTTPVTEQQLEHEIKSARSKRRKR